MGYLRRYTVTLRAVKKDYQGNKEYLKNTFAKFLSLVRGEATQTSFEKEGTNALHLHALIRCPLIKDKRLIARDLSGFHIHIEIIKFKDYENIEDIWMKYTNKESSDSSRYDLLYGNLFKGTESLSSNIIDYEI